MKIRLSLVVVFCLLTSLFACTLPEERQTETKTTVDTGETTVDTGCILDTPFSPEDLPPGETVVLPPENVVTAKKAYNFLLKKGAKKVLFVDVRTPAEIERGLPTLVDTNVPYALNRWEVNNDFVDSIEDSLEEKGLDKQTTLLLICHEGSRSARAIDLLLEQGYEKVYSVEGGIIKWKADDLPWSDEPDIEQMYF